MHGVPSMVGASIIDFQARREAPTMELVGLCEGAVAVSQNIGAVGTILLLGLSVHHGYNRALMMKCWVCF